MAEHLAEWKCTECGEISTEDKLLHAPSPFNGEPLVGCPECKSAECMRRVCDEPGCTREAGCGTPTKDGSYNGYKWSCGRHVP